MEPCNENQTQRGKELLAQRLQQSTYQLQMMEEQLRETWSIVEYLRAENREMKHKLEQTAGVFSDTDIFGVDQDQIGCNNISMY
jgi:hypothetical protein